MGTETEPDIAEVSPRDAWKILSDDTASVLVDVRTAAEWGFVGGPDLSALGKETLRVEWASWPGMTPNPTFVGEVGEQLQGLPSCILFLCRSGVRSMHAAKAVAAAHVGTGPVRCSKVREGFEGDLDDRDHRGGLNGWKARGLAWRQT